MLGPAEEVDGGGLLDDLTRVHDRDVVADLGHDSHVMRDEDHRHFVLAAKLVEEVEDLGLDRDVERSRRLVGDQETRIARERDRDHHALAHAPGEPVRVVVEALGRPWDSHLLEELDRALAGVLLGGVEVAPQRLRDLRPDLERRVERRHRVLEDHRDLAAADVLHLPVVELRQVLAVEEDRPAYDLRGRFRNETHDRERRDGLAATGLTDDPERLALLHVEADPVDRLHDAFPREEARLEVFDLE
jgi:hypothetical protein